MHDEASRRQEAISPLERAVTLCDAKAGQLLAAGACKPSEAKASRAD